MQRRAVLGALAASATAGCLGGVLDIASDGARLSLETDPVPDGLPATLSAELVSTATPEHPPRLRVGFECTADEPRTFRFSYPGPFADAVSTATDGSRLVFEYETESNDRRDGCWRSTGSGGWGAVERRTLVPGERTGIEWSVLNHSGNESCFPPGRYRFEDRYGVDGETYEWGFRLRIR
ncbi:hypothetical protein [Haladaptatus salinisoli]|uniref:hypothetical protein n=1 Tax=Haladaptatus salinisoli TaxID=2884876 RepID=UPI001D0A67A1|nr:hypothetical protein [Haladaptatus salinisoli]